MMLKARIILGFFLVVISVIFTQQNFSLVHGLHGVEHQPDLYIKASVNQRFTNDSLYPVKAKRINGNLKFIYKLNSTNYFKIPPRPFSTTIESTIESTVALVLAIILFRLLVAKEKPTKLNNMLLYYKKRIYH